MNRNKICNCGSDKKFKHCCGSKNKSEKKINKWMIWTFSIIIILFSGYGFSKILDENRKNIKSDAIYCPDCGRYH